MCFKIAGNAPLEEGEPPNNPQFLLRLFPHSRATPLLGRIRQFAIGRPQRLNMFLQLVDYNKQTFPTMLNMSCSY